MMKKIRLGRKEKISGGLDKSWGLEGSNIRRLEGRRRDNLPQGRLALH